ncbi:MAG TPA: flagellar basal-body MS-ring/collar protein FliF, partial [Burkholderiales bacterium]|nr:flagellar basal-body MS-ring/collar protein FliF [Burkholderiales bacterium]
MNELFNNITVAWARLGRAQRSILAVVAAALVVLTVVLVLWAARTDYQVLFSDLDGRDAAAIVEELKRMKVPYQVADGGTKILVDERTVHETRLRLMAHGVPLSGGVGFEIFDNKDVGMTEYTQKINYQRALQGELARTVMAINQVKQARVHLVVAENTLFKRQKVKPKASVSLVLKAGAPLSNEQILGIQRLVAASVSGLEPGAVMVLDQAGVTLSAASEGDEDYAQASGKLRL